MDGYWSVRVRDRAVPVPYATHSTCTAVVTARSAHLTLGTVKACRGRQTETCRDQIDRTLSLIGQSVIWLINDDQGELV